MKSINVCTTDAISQVYILLANSFSFPGDYLQAMAKKGKEQQNLLKTTITELPFEVETGDFPLLSLPCDDLESCYITTFDKWQGGGPPCPLYEGLVRKDEGREGIMMELLRFYHHFDVRLQEKERDFPDHLVTELEFMAFLAQKEASALERGKDPNPYRRAQRDFLDRHLDKWVHKLNERIQKNVQEPFYRGSSAFMAEFIRNHFSYLDSCPIPSSCGKENK